MPQYPGDISPGRSALLVLFLMDVKDSVAALCKGSLVLFLSSCTRKYFRGHHSLHPLLPVYTDTAVLVTQAGLRRPFDFLREKYYFNKLQLARLRHQYVLMAKSSVIHNSPPRKDGLCCQYLMTETIGRLLSGHPIQYPVNRPGNLAHSSSA